MPNYLYFLNQCLTLNLEDSSWNRGDVDPVESDVILKMTKYANGATPGADKVSKVESIQQPQDAMGAAADSSKREEQKASAASRKINMGQRVLFKVMGPSRRQMEIDQE